LVADGLKVTKYVSGFGGFKPAKLYQTIFAQSGVSPVILGAFFMIGFTDGSGNKESGFCPRFNEGNPDVSQEKGHIDTVLTYIC
jgi:hypothetical protein